MALNEDEINNIIEYYSNLLILQYSDKPKAIQQIKDYVSGLLADGLFIKIRDAFNIDTAVGNQLDVLGRYIGLDRNGENLVINFDQNLFSTVDSPLDLTPEAFGTVSEAQFPLVDSHIINEDDFITSQVLDDENYRFVLKLKIIQNNINHSEVAIDSAVNDVFGGDLIPSGIDGGMTMTYFVDEQILTSAEIAFKKGVLPRPMTVGLLYLVKKPAQKNLFGFASNGNSATFVSGFNINGNEGGKALFNSDLILP
jgi:hypothetical protein